MNRNRKLLIVVGLVLLMLVFLSACGDQPSTQAGKPEEETISIDHELGKTEVPLKPEKVLVFDYGVLDVLETIGEDVVALPKSSLPQYLENFKNDKYKDIGSLQEPNFETIYEIGPDLIIISARQAELYDEFAKIGPTIYLEMPQDKYMETFKENTKILGQIFDKEDLIAEEVKEIEELIDQLNKKVDQDKNSLFIMANDGNLSAYGQASRFGLIHNEFGLKPVDENIEASTHGQKISFEYLVEKDPDYLFVMDRAAVAGGDISAKDVMDNDLVKRIKASQNDKIIYLDAHVWYVSAGGIQSTKKMIEEVNASLD